MAAWYSVGVLATDLQVIFPSEVIELNSVSERPGLPRTLDLIGKDFRTVDEVFINEMASPSVVVLSKNRLLAQVPDGVGKSSIQSINVTSRQLTISERSLISFKIGRTPCKVRGILKLMQLYLKILFTTPGTDILAQRVGADALKNIGRSFGKEEGGSIVSDFVLANDVAVRQIVAIQSRDPSLSRDEKLLSARVRAAKFSYRETALVVSVELNSQDGRSAVANVVV